MPVSKIELLEKEELMGPGKTGPIVEHKGTYRQKGLKNRKKSSTNSKLTRQAKIRVDSEKESSIERKIVIKIDFKKDRVNHKPLRADNAVKEESERPVDSEIVEQHNPESKD